MKLAIVTRAVVRGDGQGRVALEIARYALNQGAQVTLLAERVDNDLLEAGAVQIPIRPRHKIGLVYAWEFARQADTELNCRQGQFDLVMGFGYSLTRPHDVNVAQFVHDAWARSPAHTIHSQKNMYGFYQWLYTRMNCAWERKAFQNARLVVACSNSVKKELMHIGLHQDRTHVILNAADPSEFYPGPCDRSTLGVPPDVPLILFAGDIKTPRKNLDTVLRAVQRCPSAHLAIVGKLDSSPYPALAAQLGVAERTHFLGFRHDMPQLMRAADLFVFPSRYEPFGIVVLEAMNSGIPVITSANVGAAEIITPDCGVVVADPEDAEAIAEAISVLIRDKTRRQRMAHAARAIAETHTWTDMARQYWTVFKALSDSKSMQAANLVPDERN